MILTRQKLHAGKTGPGGFKRVQVAHLGVSWPLKKGWLSGLIGREVSEEAYRAFLDGKTAANHVTVSDNPDIHQLRQSTKGWTREKLAKYGIPWPPPHGWRKKFLKANPIS